MNFKVCSKDLFSDYSWSIIIHMYQLSCITLKYVFLSASVYLAHMVSIRRKLLPALAMRKFIFPHLWNIRARVLRALLIVNNG